MDISQIVNMMTKLQQDVIALATQSAKENEKPAESVLKADTRYVYDNMRPSILAEPDKDVWLKREEIRSTMASLMEANGTKGDPVTAIEKINEPSMLTISDDADAYGLTAEKRRWLLEFIFCVEGGYFNHPNDPGGETMYGIIKTEARSFGYEGAMKNLPKEVATEIYLKKYWDKVGLKQIKNFGTAVTIFDFQVNSGIRGVKIAQKTFNRLYENKGILPAFAKSLVGTDPLSEDGVLGPKTAEMINSVSFLTFLSAYTLFQEDQYEDLMRANPKLRAFDIGWENRIVKKIIYLEQMARQNLIPLL